VIFDPFTIRKELLMQTIHFHQVQLAKRWLISERTLERWRWEGKGPAYIKIGGRVLYRIEDIEAFERKNRIESGLHSID
jgi:hypothetical protein